jgi:hypothetical protein
VWNIIEEKFRITENATQFLDSKASEFNKDKVTLTEYLREQRILLFQKDNFKL